MHGIDSAIFAVGIALYILIIACLARWGTFRKFPVFAAYLIFNTFLTAIGAVTFSNERLYYDFYWITAPVEIALALMAVMEIFWRVFQVFRLLRWFRFVLPGTIAATLMYSAWQGYRLPPDQATPSGAAIIHATVTSHYVILAVALLFFLLSIFLAVSLPMHQHRFMLGFALVSLAVVFGGSVRMAFGPYSDFVSREGPPLGYLAALLIWLSAALRPVPEQPAFHSLSEAHWKKVVENLKIQLHYLSSFARNSRR